MFTEPKAFGKILKNTVKDQYKATAVKPSSDLTPEQQQIQKICQANNIKYTPKTEEALKTIFEKTKNNTKITLNSDFGFAEGKDDLNAGKIIDKTKIVDKKEKSIISMTPEEGKIYIQELRKYLKPNASEADVEVAKYNTAIKVLSPKYTDELSQQRGEAFTKLNRDQKENAITEYAKTKGIVTANIYKELDAKEIKEILNRNEIPPSELYSQDLQFLPTINKLAGNTAKQLENLFQNNNIPSDKLEQTKSQISGLVRNYINAVSPEVSTVYKELPKNYQANVAQYVEDNKVALGTEIAKEKYSKLITNKISQELEGLKEYIKDAKNFPTLEPTKYSDLKNNFNQITRNLNFEKPTESVANKIESYQKYCTELEKELTTSLENTQINRRDLAKKAIPALGKTLLNALKLDATKAREEVNKFTQENQNRKNQQENLATTINGIQTIIATLDNAKNPLAEKISTVQLEKIDDKFLASNMRQINEKAQAQLAKETMLADAQASQNNDLQHFINRTKDITGITAGDLEKGVKQSVKMKQASLKTSPLQNKLSQDSALASRTNRTTAPRKSALASNVITNDTNSPPITSAQFKPMGQRRSAPIRPSKLATSNIAAPAPSPAPNEPASNQKPPVSTVEARREILKSALASKGADRGVGSKLGAIRGSALDKSNTVSSNANPNAESPLSRKEIKARMDIKRGELARSAPIPQYQAHTPHQPVEKGNNPKSTIITLDNGDQIKLNDLVKTSKDTKIDATWDNLQKRENTRFLTKGGQENITSQEKAQLMRTSIAQFAEDNRHNNFNNSLKLGGEVDENLAKLSSKDRAVIALSSKALKAIDKGKIKTADKYLERIDNIDKPGLLKKAAIVANDKIVQPLALKSANKVQQLQSDRNKDIKTAKDIGIVIASAINKYAVQKIAGKSQEKTNSYKNKKEERTR